MGLGGMGKDGVRVALPFIEHGCGIFSSGVPNPFRSEWKFESQIGLKISVFSSCSWKFGFTIQISQLLFYSEHEELFVDQKANSTI